MQLRSTIIIELDRLAKMVRKNRRNGGHVSFSIEAADFTSLDVFDRAFCRITTIEIHRTEGEVSFHSFVSSVMVFRESAEEKLSSEELETRFSYLYFVC